MLNLDTDSMGRLSWYDRALPNSVLNRTRDESRSARVLLAGVASASAICILFTFVHVSYGELSRALVSALTCIPIVGTLFLVRHTKHVQPAMHVLLGICTGVVTVGPLLAGEGTPALIALVIVPVSAALMVGASGGIFWSVIVTGLLVGYARFFPYSEAERNLAWLTAIIAGGGGFAAALIERARERANQLAEIAREAAESDARNRLLAEVALHESQARFATAFQKSPSILLLVDAESGKILDANESFVQISGWTAAEAIGKTFGDLSLWVSPDDQNGIREYAIARGNMNAVEVRMRAKSGALAWILSSVEVLQGIGGNCLLIQASDITARKQSDEELARTREQLETRFAERGEQLQESRIQLRHRDRLAAVGTLAAGLAHQINNPIGGIVAATEFATVADDDPDREGIRTEAIAVALREAKRCGRIVKNILKFSRDEPTAKWVEDLSFIVSGATQLARTHVVKRGGQLKLDLAKLPLLVHASPIDIEQVVLNLVHNASESKRDGANVQVQTRRRNEFAEIVVSDDGDGIAPEAQSHIFEPFYTSRLDDGGSGLGLSVVHGIIGDHGGKIEVEGVPSGGTRIRILLPLAQTESISST